MPVPAFREDGWLPEGHHAATWEEIASVFGGEPGSHRQELLNRLLAWRDACRAHGVTGLLILNGSFISAKVSPGDVDCIFVFDEPVMELLKTNVVVKELLDINRNKEAGLAVCRRDRLSAFS